MSLYSMGKYFNYLSQYWERLDYANISFIFSQKGMSYDLSNWKLTGPLTALSTALDKPIGYRGAGSPAHVNHQRWLNNRPGEVQA